MQKKLATFNRAKRSLNNMNNAPLIVHIIYRFDIGGLESVLVNMINTMPEQSYRHVIISLTESSEFERRINRDDVEVICLHKQAGNDPKIHLKIWQLLRQLKPVCTHTYNISTLEYNVISFLAGIKKRIHAEHGRDIYDLDGSNKKYQYLRRFVNPFVTQWIPVSKELADWLVRDVKLPKPKVNLIYNGIDLELYIPKKHQNKKQFIVGTVGRMAAVKDQLTLIKAIEVLITEYPELKNIIRLDVVGDGELYSSLQSYIEEYSLTANIKLLGTRNDVANILQSFDIFVLPSLAEGIPLTILEAMATSLPVISTRVGGVPELIENDINGYLISPQDVNSLAIKIRHYIDRPELIKKHGNNGRLKVVGSFSLQAMTDQYLRVYNV